MVPKVLNRRFAIVTGLAILGAVAFMPKASAQTTNQNVLFDITTYAACTFASPLPGTLVWNSGTPAVVTSTGGTPATVNLTCTDPNAVLSVGLPSNTVGTLTPAVTGLLSSVAWTAGTPGTATNTDGVVTGANTIGVAVTNAPLTVNMNYTANGSIPSGTYEFTVTVTATAN
ncbi:hypothetical protein VB712_14660 [Spirulina sp. CCNP1310]|uniref:hypothetical protein n=1 Tax=Spirulina sp. CCNP1310 TaxID=3110249 RepID=UPI002B1FAD45|nr:hypothetical protein [Spirulina sp. CCNP1310]MEA5420471.1 hypothetical protein [Spirulina sp. CCNP1310]